MKFFQFSLVTCQYGDFKSALRWFEIGNYSPVSGSWGIQEWYQELSKKFQVHVSSVRNMVKKWKDRNVKVRKRSGQPRNIYPDIKGKWSKWSQRMVNSKELQEDLIKCFPTYLSLNCELELKLATVDLSISASPKSWI